MIGERKKKYLGEKKRKQDELKTHLGQRSGQGSYQPNTDREGIPHSNRRHPPHWVAGDVGLVLPLGFRPGLLLHLPRGLRWRWAGGTEEPQGPDSRTPGDIRQGRQEPHQTAVDNPPAGAYALLVNDGTQADTQAA